MKQQLPHKENSFQTVLDNLLMHKHTNVTNSSTHTPCIHVQCKTK